jgi:uncharacterized SAM-binding protein YcdF (DUF218 family)
MKSRFLQILSAPWKRVSFWVGCAVVVIVALIFFTPWPSDILAQPLTSHERERAVDAVVILGSGVRKGDDPLPLQAKLRVARGVEVAALHGVPIIVSGGYNKKTKLYEAPLLADEALRLGMEPGDLLLESASRSTYENATQSLAIVREHAWQSIAVVTSDYHTWRACRVFRKQFSSVTCVSAPSRDPSDDSVGERIGRFRGMVREYGAIAYYWVKGYL